MNTYCQNFDNLALDLISKMLVYDPCKRISAKAALSHVILNVLFQPYFDDLDKSGYANVNSI